MDGVGCVRRSVCESISGFRTGKKLGHGGSERKERTHAGTTWWVCNLLYMTSLFKILRRQVSVSDSKKALQNIKKGRKRQKKADRQEIYDSGLPSPLQLWPSPKKPKFRPLPPSQNSFAVFSKFASLKPPDFPFPTLAIFE